MSLHPYSSLSSSAAARQLANPFKLRLHLNARRKSQTVTSRQSPVATRQSQIPQTANGPKAHSPQKYQQQQPTNQASTQN